MRPLNANTRLARMVFKNNKWALGIWWKVFLWGAACNAVIYGIATIIAAVNLRAHKSARLYFPVLMLVMGLISTFTVLLVSCKY